MRYLLLILALLLAAPVLAQTDDDDDNPCAIDLSTAAALLVRAQAQASADDTAAALTTLAEIESLLRDIRSGCDLSPALEPTPEPDADPATPAPESTTEPEPPTTQTYTDPNGTFAFDYPLGWVALSDGLTVFTGTTEAAARAMTQPDGVVSAGQAGAAVAVGDAATLAPTVSSSAGVTAVIDAYRSALGVDLNYGVSDVVTLDTLDGARFAFEAPGFDGVLSVIALDDTLALVLTVAPVGQMSEAVTLADDVLASLRLIDAA